MTKELAREAQALQKLLPYLPIDRRLALTGQIALPQQTQGAALFADISGFTPLSLLLMQELGRKHGAELLLSYLNPLYGSLIEILHSHQGCVISFVGDAIIGWFAGNEASRRAITCGLAMQEAARPFATQYTPQGTAVAFSIKVAIAAGQGQRLIVGNPAIQQFDIIASSAMARIAAAEKLAQAGEVVASREVVQELGSDIEIAAWREGNVAVIATLHRSSQPLHWPTLQVANLPDEAIRPWVLPTVYPKLQSGGRYLGDLRPITPMMFRLSGLDFDQDTAAGRKLAEFVIWAQTIIYQHGGTFLELIIDNKGVFVYAPFGAPTAHEDDTRRALRAAIALQHPPRKLDWLPPLRIGVSRGDVWTGNVGSETRHTYAAMGREVNLTARLMEQARPGQILVSRRVWKSVNFRYLPIGEITYKGFPEPIPTYELLGEGEIQSNLFHTPLVGRQEELSQLLDFAQSVMDRRRAGVALIYGEPGMGKSHLTHALRQAMGKRAVWIRGQSDPVLPQAFNPFVYFLKVYFGQTAGGSDPTAALAENKTNFQRRLDELLASLPNDSKQRSALIRAQSFLAALLGLHWPDSLYAQSDARDRYRNTQMALSALLQAECLRQPVVLELEDAHWLDSASQEMLTILTSQAAHLPLLLLVMSRYQDDGQAIRYPVAAETPALTLNLDRLSADGLRQLAASLLNAPISDALHEALLEKSGANPFFAQQIIYYLQENGRFHPILQNGQFTITLINDDFDLPPSLNGLLIARLDRLAQPVKEVVQTAAVLGYEFETRHLSQMLEQDITAEIAAAEKEQIWTWLTTQQYVFKHVLLRDAAYEMQLRTRRRDLHCLAAITGEKLYAPHLSAYYATLAHHYEAAYLLGRADAIDKARHYLHQAGAVATATFQNDEAANYFSRALAITSVEDIAGRYALYLSREQAHHLAGDRPAQQKDLAELSQLAKQLGDREQAQAALRQANYAEAIGDFEQAMIHAQMAITWAENSHAFSMAAEGYITLGRTRQKQGKHRLSQEAYQQGLRMAQKAGDKNQVAHCLRGFGIIASHEAAYEQALNHFQQALKIYRETGNLRGKGGVLNNMGITARRQGDDILAMTYYEQALEIHQKIGDLEGEATVLINMGVMSRAQGDFSQAVDYIERGLAVQRWINDLWLEAASLSNLGLVYQQMGEAELGRSYSQQAVTIARKMETSYILGYALTHLGRSLFNLGRLAEAEAIYKEAHHILHDEMDRPEMALEPLAGMVEVALARDELDQAMAKGQAIYAYLKVHPSCGPAMDPIWVYLTCYKALATGGDMRGATAVLTQGLRVLLEAVAKQPAEIRQSYLATPSHAGILTAWQSRHSQ